MNESLRVLMITSEYPTADQPHIVPFIARQVAFLRQNGIDVEVFHFKGNKNPLKYLIAWRRLRKQTSRKRFDIVHAQWGQSATLALPNRTPMVITFRGNDLEGIVGANGKITFIGHIQKTVSKMMARLAEEVIVVSESLGRHLSRKDFHIVPSGLDLDLFRPMPKTQARVFLGLPMGKRLILFAASNIHNPRKRYDLAAAAVELVKEKFDAELIVASDVPHSTIPYYMNAADALLLTSVHEGSPNVVKEALACDLPIVSVNVGDVARRIGKVDGCVVCEESTPEAIAAGLERVLTESRRVSGYEAICDLDEAIIARRVIDVYKKAILKSEMKSSFFSRNDKEFNSQTMRF